MIENIVFDMGNVLYSFDYHNAHEGLAPYFDIDFDTFNREIVYGKTKEECDCGRITPRELYQWIVETYGLRCEYSVFRTAWQSIFTPIPEMIELGIGLRKQYGVYLLSTTDEAHMDEQKANTELLQVTDRLGLSYELGAIKPDRVIYERFLEMFDLKGETCVFIDDIEENARGAEQVGMVWIHHRSTEETKAQLKELGIKIS